MLINKENKKNAKIIKTALKHINKNYVKSKKYAGRFEIIDCFRQIDKTEYEGLLSVYYFEWKDKKQNKSKFFQFNIVDFMHRFSLEEFEKKLSEAVSHFEVFQSGFWSESKR